VHFSLFGHMRRQSRLLALNSCWADTISRHFVQTKNSVAIQQKVITFAYSCIVLRSFSVLYSFLCLFLLFYVKQCFKLLFFLHVAHFRTRSCSLYMCLITADFRRYGVRRRNFPSQPFPLIICQKYDTVFQFRFLKHFGISVMCTTACTLLLPFV